MEHWELAARESIRELVATYTHLVDRGRFDDVVELFVPGGVLEVHGEPAHRGRDAIRTFLGGVGDDLGVIRPARLVRHHVTNLRIDVESPSAARGACYFLVVTDAGLDHWGRYRDTYAADAARWRFAHRYVRTDGAVAGGFASRRAPQGP